MNIYLTYQVVHGRVLAACLLKNSKILKIVNLLLTSILLRDVMKLVTRKLAESHTAKENSYHLTSNDTNLC